MSGRALRTEGGIGFAIAMSMAESPAPFSQIDQDVRIERWVESTCGLCSVGCRLDIGVSGGRIVGVRGRVGHPVNDGRLGPKGLNQYFANRSPQRALYPRVRNAQGKLVRASWDEAMDLMVERVNEALATEGPDGVAVYNSGQLLLEGCTTRLARSLEPGSALRPSTRTPGFAPRPPRPR